MFFNKDKIDALIDKQNRKLSRQAKLKAKKQAKLSRLESKSQQIENKIVEINRIIDYKVDNLQFEIEELDNLITLKACTNTKKKSLISPKQTMPAMSEKEREIIKNAVKKIKRK